MAYTRTVAGLSLLIALLAVAAASAAGPVGTSSGEEIVLPLSGIADGDSVSITFSAVDIPSGAAALNLSGVRLPFTLSGGCVTASGAGFRSIRYEMQKGEELWIRQFPGSAGEVSDPVATVGGEYTHLHILGQDPLAQGSACLSLTLSGVLQESEGNPIRFALDGGTGGDVTVTVTRNGEDLVERRLTESRRAPPAPSPTGSPTPPVFATLEGVPVTYVVSVPGVTVSGDNALSVDRLKARGAQFMVSVAEDSIVISREAAVLTIGCSNIQQTARNITGEFKSLRLAGGPQYANLSCGVVEVWLEAWFERMPVNSTVQVVLREGGDAEALQRAADRSRLDLVAVAYTAEIAGVNATRHGPAAIRMSIPAAWLDERGGISSIRIARIAGGGAADILQTTYTGLNQKGDPLFEAQSPDGLSSFALVAVKARSVPTTPNNHSPIAVAEEIVDDAATWFTANLILLMALASLMVVILMLAFSQWR